MDLNLDKSHVIYIKAKPKSKKEMFQLPKAIHGIKLVKKAKYLGVIIDQSLYFEE